MFEGVILPHLLGTSGARYLDDRRDVTVVPVQGDQIRSDLPFVR